MSCDYEKGSGRSDISDMCRGKSYMNIRNPLIVQAIGHSARSDKKLYRLPQSFRQRRVPLPRLLDQCVECDLGWPFASYFV
jgi:hypothetical protein